MKKEKTGVDTDIGRFRSDPEEKEKDKEKLKPQKTLTAEVHTANHERLLDLLDVEGQARLLGYSMPFATMYTKCSPITALGRRMNTSDYSLAIARQLGLQLLPFSGLCALCGKPMREPRTDRLALLTCSSPASTEATPKPPLT